jgi:hypothetical protein
MRANSNIPIVARMYKFYLYVYSEKQTAWRQQGEPQSFTSASSTQETPCAAATENDRYSFEAPILSMCLAAALQPNQQQDGIQCQSRIASRQARMMEHFVEPPMHHEHATLAGFRLARSVDSSYCETQ